MTVAAFDHIFFWRTLRRGWTRERKGERCRVLARGAKGTILVEFEDGFRVFTGRYAVRPSKV